MLSRKLFAVIEQTEMGRSKSGVSLARSRWLSNVAGRNLALLIPSLSIQNGHKVRGTETAISKSSELDLLTVVIEPVKRVDVTEFVVERLKLLLEKGTLKPRSKLPPDPEMCKLLEVRWPSLRQAYKALSILGVIRAVPRDGTYISDSTSEMLSAPFTFLTLMKKITLDGVFDFRILLEVDLARRAASGALQQEKAAMKALLDVMAKSRGEEQSEAYSQAEYKFHNCVACAARSPLLLKVTSMFRGLLWETRRKLVNFVRDRSEDYEQHYQIYKAILAGDAEATGLPCGAIC